MHRLKIIGMIALAILLFVMWYKYSYTNHGEQYTTNLETIEINMWQNLLSHVNSQPVESYTYNVNNSTYGKQQ